LLRRLAVERGFTLIELLVAMILIGILAAIALAVFLNQEDKGRDAAAKSNVTNVAHLVQACNASNVAMDDYRNCDMPSKFDSSTGLPLSSDAPTEISSGDCGNPAPTDTVTLPDTVRIFEAGQDCFVILGISHSGNHFWYVKHNDGLVTRDCTTRSQNGC